MAEIDFTGVEEAKEKVMTRPGTIALFKISDVKFASTEQKSTYYMGVTFSRAEDEFSHRFYLTLKSLPKLKPLVKHASGVVLEDKVQEEKLIALLKGKEVALKVTGRINEEDGRAYPDLSFGGFSKEPARIGELAFNSGERDINEKCAAIYASTSTTTADEPVVMETGSLAPAAPAAPTEEIF